MVLLFPAGAGFFFFFRKRAGPSPCPESDETNPFLTSSGNVARKGETRDSLEAERCPTLIHRIWAGYAYFKALGSGVNMTGDCKAVV